MAWRELYPEKLASGIATISFFSFLYSLSDTHIIALRGVKTETGWVFNGNWE
jgi:hypothetical protein